MASTIQPSLPSSDSAFALVQHQPGAFWKVLLHTGARAGIIGTGLFLTGTRKDLLKTSIIASLSIEAFVLGFTYWASKQQQP